MSFEFSYVTIDNPSQHIEDPWVWTLFARALKFRNDQLQDEFPEQTWIEGCDMHASHSLVLHDTEVVACTRTIPLKNHSKYLTISPIDKIISAQSPELRDFVSRSYENSVPTEFFAEFGQFIVHRDYRASRLGLKSKLRDRLLTYSMYANERLGIRGLVGLPREEVNVGRIMNPIGFAYMKGCEELTFKTGTPTRIMICPSLKPEYKKLIETFRNEFDTQCQIHTRRRLRPFGVESISEEVPTRIFDDSNACP